MRMMMVRVGLAATAMMAANALSAATADYVFKNGAL